LTLAARHALPTIFPFRDFTEAGGMMSYGSGFDDFRQVGIYTGRIQGAKSAELPVMQASKFEFIINLHRRQGRSGSTFRQHCSRMPTR